jgi:hypothetical protein
MGDKYTVYYLGLKTWEVWKNGVDIAACYSEANAQAIVDALNRDHQLEVLKIETKPRDRVEFVYEFDEECRKIEVYRHQYYETYRSEKVATFEVIRSNVDEAEEIAKAHIEFLQDRACKAKS